MNLYQGMNSNPVNFVDPMGEEVVEAGFGDKDIFKTQRYKTGNKWLDYTVVGAFNEVRNASALLLNVGANLIGAVGDAHDVALDKADEFLAEHTSLDRGEVKREVGYMEAAAIGSPSTFAAAGKSAASAIGHYARKAGRLFAHKKGRGVAKIFTQERTPSILAKGDAKRIQDAANKSNQDIIVVGSRAKGTATDYSDWDYILTGKSSQRHKVTNSLPRGKDGGEVFRPGIDLWQNYNPAHKFNYNQLDKKKPYIIFKPKQ